MQIEFYKFKRIFSLSLSLSVHFPINQAITADHPAKESNKKKVAKFQMQTNKLCEAHNIEHDVRMIHGMAVESRCKCPRPKSIYTRKTFSNVPFKIK